MSRTRGWWVAMVLACSCLPTVTDPPPMDGCPPLHTGDAAEADECPALAKRVFADGTYSRSLLPAGDQDWFSLQTTPGHAYLLTAAGGSAEAQLVLEVWDAEGTQLLAENRGADSIVELAARAPGDRLLIRVRELRATATGDYELRISDLGPDDFADDAAAATTISPGARPAGALQFEGDVDVLLLDVPANTGVKLGFAAQLGGVLLDVDDGDGRRLTLDPSNSVELASKVSARYVLTARAMLPAVQPWHITVEETGADDFPATPVFAPRLEVRDDGVIDRYGDIDTWRIELPSGHVGVLTVTPGLFVSVADAFGGSVTRVGGSRAPTWRSTGAPVFASVARASVDFVRTPYSLVLRELVDDYGDTAATATPVQSGVPVEGMSELSDDVDVFTITVDAGVPLEAQVTVSLSVALLRPDGALLGGGNGSAVGVAPGGPVTVEVRRSANALEEPLAYSLTVFARSPDDFGGDVATATLLSLGSPMSGELSWSLDQDVFAFDVQAGHIYRVRCSSGADWCSSLQVYSASWSGQAGNAFLATVDDRWFVHVGPSAQVPYRYELLVEDRGLEDHGATAATGTALALGTTASGLIGFAGDLDFFVVTTVPGHFYRIACTGIGGLCQVQPSTTFPLDVRSVFKASSASTAIKVGGPLDLSYGISVEDLGADDHGDGALDATVLSLSSAATAGVAQSYLDSDVFEVTPAMGTLARVVVEATALVDVSFSTQGMSFGSSLPGALRHEYGLPGTGAKWLITVRSQFAAPAAYTVRAELGTDAHSGVTPLTLGVPVSGAIDFVGDVDSFSVNLSGPVRITLSAGVSATIHPPVGANVVQTGTGLPQTFTPTMPDTYFIELRGLTNDVAPWVLLVE